MLLLTSTSDLLTLVTSATASIDVHASWVDNASGAITPGRTNTATISTATTTTIVASPAGSTQRNVKFLSVRNRHASTSCDVTVKHTDGTNNLELMKVTLAAGEELSFADDFGWAHYLATGAIKTGFDPNNVAFTGGTMSGVGITAKAGTTSAAGLKFPTGTLETSALAGDVEYDGSAFYLSHVASARGVARTEQFLALTATYTLTSTTATQKLFNIPTNGSLTVAALTTYFFECFFSLSSMSATSGNTKFDVLGAGTATLTSSAWTAVGQDSTTPGTAGAPGGSFTATNVSSGDIVTAAVNTGLYADIRGIVRINAAGTIIPSVGLTTAAAAVVGVNSYFRIWPVGSNTVTAVGNWS
jgi:hypothetical protein